MSHSHKHDHHHNIDFSKAFTVTKEPGSQVKITGEIPYEELLNERSASIKSLGANLSLDGFRKGHIPEDVLVKHLGEMNILAEMAERTISHFYPHIIEAHELDPIGHPKIEITKIAPSNPLGLTLTVAVLPPVTLGDYQKIAKDLNKTKDSKEVTEEEVEKQIAEILRQKQAYERIQAKAVAKQSTPESDNKNVSETTESGDDFKITKEPLPELTDELVKTLGQPDQFKDVADFKAKIKEHLTVEKAGVVKSAHRAKLTDAIIEASQIDLPQILIDSEIEQMFAQMEDDLNRSNLKMADYLTHIKKTKEELRSDWTPQASKRAKLQLILNKIAEAEKITPDQDKVSAQVKELTTAYKDADPRRVLTYVTSILTNEAVMQKLEETT